MMRQQVIPAGCYKHVELQSRFDRHIFLVNDVTGLNEQRLMLANGKHLKNEAVHLDVIVINDADIFTSSRAKAALLIA
jgi:hypothetical protein